MKPLHLWAWPAHLKEGKLVFCRKRNRNDYAGMVRVIVTLAPKHTTPTILAWIPKSKRMPLKTQTIVCGSWRDGEWTMSSVSKNGWAPWIDNDRTHWLTITCPRQIKPPTLAPKRRRKTK